PGGAARGVRSVGPEPARGRLRAGLHVSATGPGPAVPSPGPPHVSSLGQRTGGCERIEGAVIRPRPAGREGDSMKHLTWLLATACGLCLGSVDALAHEQGSLGVGVGIVKPEDSDSTVWFTANFRIPVGEHLALEPEGGYWKKTNQTPVGEASV